MINGIVIIPGKIKPYLTFFPTNTDDNGFVEFHTPYELFTSDYLENNQKLYQWRSPLSSLVSDKMFESLYSNAIEKRDLPLALYWCLTGVIKKQRVE